MRSGRAVSPAASENEVDILDSLYTDDGGRVDAQDGMAFDAEDIFGGGARGGPGYEDDDGDEAFIALTQAASFRKTGNLKSKSAKKGGGFQAMGLNANLLRAITRKGFSVPTPIQRKAIPLILERKDLVGMARTGSGKTAAFVIPMIERLRAHSATIGSRGLILSPSRELAIQTLKVVKEFSKGTDLKCVLLVGGDSLEEQFGSMTSNPDIVIATPGRFLHLKVEMGLSLSSVQYVVFDEADRLFEMGFAAQLTEILHALPLRGKVCSFLQHCRHRLQDPSLVRLDAETKVSPDLESAFFSVKSAEKEGALLHILHDLIQMPLGLPAGVKPESDRFNNKRKRVPDKSRGREKPTEHSTIIFAATKHHVEYLATLLKEAGFAVSYVYGSLDQTARMEQVDNFRKGRSNILVVTDVAARGIDIPILANVINYDFPPQPKVFVHRVGRTARAGQRGWSYSIVRDTDVPYLIDLQLFLGKKLVLGRESESPNYAEDVVVGAAMRSKVEANVEWQTKILGDDEDLKNLKRVSEKAEKLYLRTRNSASSQSAKRARDVVASKGWTQLHPVFGGESGDLEQARAEMLAKLSGYRPTETIFESKMMNGKGLKNDAADIMANMRQKIKLRPQDELNNANMDIDSDVGDDDAPFGDEDEALNAEDDEVMVEGNSESDDDDGLEVTVTNNETASKKSKKNKNQTPASYQDPEVFMSYEPRTFNATEERGYGVHSGGNTTSVSFVESARDATMDLNNDEGGKAFGVPTRSKMRWDQKSRKYVARDNDEDGSKGARLVRGESGVKIAASFQSGRFDRWKKAQRIGSMPRVGDSEKKNGGPPNPFTSTGPRYKHKMEKAPKDADKYRDDYHERKKRVDEAKEKRIGRFKEGVGINRNELKSTEDVRKSRKLAERRRAKNARPTHKK
ncbi:ATP-dependent RNA helicase DBP10 [Apiospora marii]|uniref:ATP-dependent RNA helicase DBP10 n=1 Tax=Apiospora marii TaxID=335849 RepID=UPI003130A429